MQNELEQLKRVNNDKRLQEVRSAFEAFLKDLFDQKTGQTYGSLIWIAETYYGLAQGSEGEDATASKYYGNAAKTYEDILTRAKGDSQFVDPIRLPGVRLRLVNCKRREGDYESAETLITEVLAEKPKVLDAQMEAARVYQEWGTTDSLQSEKLKIAIEGNTESAVWGWNQIATRLQFIIEGGKGTPEYQEKYYEARYNLLKSRFDYANTLPDADKKNKHLDKAEYELVAFSRITPDLPDTEWWNKFDTVYQDIQVALGRTPIALEKPEKIVVVSTDLNGSEIASNDQNSVNGKNAEDGPESGGKKKGESSGGIMTTLMVIAVLLIGMGLVAMFVMNGNKKKKPVVASQALPDVLPTPAATGKRTSKTAAGKTAAGKTGQKPKPQTRRPAGSGTEGKKQPTAEGKPPAAKIKKKRPADPSAGTSEKKPRPENQPKPKKRRPNPEA